MIKGKSLQIFLGVSYALLLGMLLYFTPAALTKWEVFLENGAYDFQISHIFKIPRKTDPVVIVDIDDETLHQEGQWPWPRSRLGELVQKINKLGSIVVAFDFIFSESQKNIADQISTELQKQPSEQSSVALSEIDKIKSSFDFDTAFANSLTSGNCVLGFVFTDEGDPNGALPPPLLTLSPSLVQELLIPDMKSYIGNLPLLQTAAKNGAFLNASPDSDGVNRKAPLLLRRGTDVYPSLALEAVRIYLLASNPELLTSQYQEATVLEGIKLDQWVIPTDPMGRLLIPYRGPAYTFPYISASHILHDKVSQETLAGKLVFIGSSATGMGDLLATPISPSFPGVEIHADIASGILDHYLPNKPAWAKGASVGLILLFGLLAAFWFPFLGPLQLSGAFIALFLTLVGINYYTWINSSLVFSMIMPLYALTGLYLINLILGFVFETKNRQRIKAIFSQYLPKERVELLVGKEEREFGLEGESKELSILFSDIRNFTHFSETMTSIELKQFLNQYFTLMTEVIFKYKGTMDKYMGDAIMAFWGAPLEDPNHAFNAVSVGYQMLLKLEEFNKGLLKEKKSPIQIGIGINTGVMNVGDMGSEFRRAYTVIGDAVNLASRLENLTKYYTVKAIVGEETEQRTKNAFVYRKLDRVRVKGKEHATYIYELICPIETATPEILNQLKNHNLALEAYLAKNWNEADRLFQALAASDPSHEHFYHIYLDRIAAFKATPPPADWDGVFTFQEK